MSLSLTIEARNGFNEATNEFITIEPTTLTLEHSLFSLKKWEQKYHIPFLDQKIDKTMEQWLYYIECMCLTENVNPDVFKYMSKANIEKVIAYMQDSMTASNVYVWGKEQNKKETVTAEIIYYWMFELGLPLELEHWHLNQLIMQIRVINAKHDPKKMSHQEAAMQRSALNAQRRAKYHSKG